MRLGQEMHINAVGALYGPTHRRKRTFGACAGRQMATSRSPTTVLRVEMAKTVPLF